MKNLNKRTQMLLAIVAMVVVVMALVVVVMLQMSGTTEMSGTALALPTRTRTSTPIRTATPTRAPTLTPTPPLPPRITWQTGVQGPSIRVSTTSSNCTWDDGGFSTYISVNPTSGSSTIVTALKSFGMADPYIILKCAVPGQTNTFAYSCQSFDTQPNGTQLQIIPNSLGFQFLLPDGNICQ